MNLVMIDDNEVDQMIYRRIVERSGLVAELMQFTDPHEALDYLVGDPETCPDLILLDINMPGMDGFEFLDKATNMLGAKMCPVFVMLTTSLDPRDEERARRFEVVKDFLNKPLTVSTLEHISHLCRGTRKSA